MKTIVRFPTDILLIVISVLGLSWFSWAQAADTKQAVAPLAETVSGQVSLSNVRRCNRKTPTQGTEARQCVHRLVRLRRKAVATYGGSFSAVT
jgi:ribosomal protein L40E